MLRLLARVLPRRAKQQHRMPLPQRRLHWLHNLRLGRAVGFVLEHAPIIILASTSRRKQPVEDNPAAPPPAHAGVPGNSAPHSLS